MSKETKEDLVLLIITSVTSAIGMTSVFVDCRLLAWIAILVSDAYIFLVLLLAAILSEDDAFAIRRPWISGFFPSRTGALFVFPLLFLSIVSGFAGLYVGAEVFQSSKTSVDAFYISLFTMGFTDYSPKPGYGQFIVIGQLVSAILYLAGAFPLLISRISTFRSP